MNVKTLTCALALALCGCSDDKPDPVLPPPPELLGRWRDTYAADETIEFRSNGTVQEINRFRVSDGQYRALGRNRVEVDLYDSPQGPRVYTYHIVGDRLELEPPLPVIGQTYVRVK